MEILSDLKHRVFPRPFERLSSLRGRRCLTGVEIGVCGGEHAASLLRNLDIDRLYLVDPYALYDDYQEGNAHYGVDQPDLSESERSARSMLHPYQDKTVWIRDYSADAIRSIPEDVDFVYIDGNHQESYVDGDIRGYLDLVKPGGVIGGHDFYNGFQRDHDGVINAVVRFAAETNSQLRVELPDWWIEL